jgi:hypothetical protein
VYLTPQPTLSRRNTLSVKLRAAATARAMWTVAALGAELDVAIGAHLRRRDIFIYGGVGYMGGETLHGLDVHRMWVGSQIEFEIGPVHLGPAPSVSFLLVERRTRDTYFKAVGIGAEGLALVDLFRDDDQAFFLEGRFGAHYIVPAPFWGGSFGLGARL